MAKSRVKGLSTVRAQIQAAPVALQGQVRVQLGRTVDEIRAQAIANMDAMGIGRRTGRMRRLYRTRLAQSTLVAHVGYNTRSARRRAFHARILHYGTDHLPARPFHDLAVDAETPAHNRRMLTAAEAAFNPRMGGPRR